LSALGGGCQVPIGAHATVADGRVHLLAIVASPDGAALASRGRRRGGEAAELGRRLGRVAGAGAREILEAAYPEMKVHLIGATRRSELITCKGGAS
jgi:hydroxymethylbilane synthase